jgi:hypothetical protein
MNTFTHIWSFSYPCTHGTGKVRSIDNRANDNIGVADEGIG